MIMETTVNGIKLKGSRLFCPIDEPMTKVFFSLVDYRNNYFTSDDPKKVVEFYNGFKNREQLLRWMSERPKGVAKIHEVEGDKDIIVVIPTADFNGRYARECRESIFKTLHMIFVESGGREDFYFNFAHNSNVGLKIAMKYYPKWIVFTADDRYRIDDISILLRELRRRVGIPILLFPKFFPRSTFKHYVGRLNLVGRSIRSLLTHMPIVRNNILLYRTMLLKKLLVDYNFALPGILNNRILTEHNKKYYFGDIETVIFPKSLMEKHCEELLFDEHFINGMEDHDFLLRLSLLKIPYEKINYSIGLYYNSSLGVSIARDIRGVINLLYFSSKFEYL